MRRPRALVLRAPGSNCDQETEHALELAGAAPERVHINRFLNDSERRGEHRLEHYDILVIPGGFTYADDIAAGRVLANRMRLGLQEDLTRFVAAGRPILGICNGFQILLETGLLQPQVGGEPSAVLTTNDSGLFECRWTELRVDHESICPLTEGLDAVVSYPVAHGEGKFFASPEALARLEAQRRVVLRYKTPAAGRYPENPNGSLNDIAGVCDVTGRILGLMPHPERAHCRRGASNIASMGRRLFDNLVTLARGAMA